MLNISYLKERTRQTTLPPAVALTRSCNKLIMKKLKVTASSYLERGRYEKRLQKIDYVNIGIEWSYKLIAWVT